MSSAVRKLSVGKNFPDGAIHYQVGKKVRLNDKPYEIVQILQDGELFNIGKLAYNIYIADDNSTILWKTPVDLPFVIEQNISFE